METCRFSLSRPGPELQTALRKSAVRTSLHQYLTLRLSILWLCSRLISKSTFETKQLKVLAWPNESMKINQYFKSGVEANDVDQFLGLGGQLLFNKKKKINWFG